MPTLLPARQSLDELLPCSKMLHSNACSGNHALALKQAAVKRTAKQQWLAYEGPGISSVAAPAMHDMQGKAASAWMVIIAVGAGGVLARAALIHSTLHLHPCSMLEARVTG